MFNPRRIFLPLALLLLSGCSATTSSSTAATNNNTTTTTIPNLQPYADPTGTLATYTSASSIDLTNAFFQPLGTNNRTCATCHQIGQGMSINVASTQALFTSTSGTDPLFATIDGANCPTAATGNASQHSLLLNNGLIRIAITVPSTAQYKLTVLSDPYGCAVTTNSAGQQVVSVYRRPLPATSTADLSAVMWDERETIAPLDAIATFAANLNTDLTQQAIDAVSTHAQGTTTPTAAQLAEITSFEQSLFTAQITDTLAGSLSSNGALGGPANLAAQNYYPGINDSGGNDPTGAPFNAGAMTLYKSWNNSANAQQASIARGEALFNTGILTISDAPGINGTVQHGSCSFCHDTPNIGNRSIASPIDTGTAHIASAEPDPNIVAGLTALSAASLPVYQITGCLNPATHQPVTYTTTDPGVGLSTGLCADINRTKVPILRGLAARAPYFHAGSAATLQQVVAFYNARFAMNLTPQQQTDLANFLAAL